MRAPIQCVVLVRPLDAATPGSWLRLGGRPFFDYLLLEAWRFGFRRVLFIADGGASRVRASLDASMIGEEVRLSIDIIEARGAGTGGGLKAASSRLEEQFLLLDGDCWFDFNWLSLVTGAGSPDAVAVLALRKVQRPSRRIPVEIDGTSVRAAGVPAAAGVTTGGVAIATRRILEHLSPACSLEEDVYPRLAQLGALRGIVASGRFVDVVDPADRAVAGTALPQWRQRPAVFLDRDGTLNADTGYVHRAADFHWQPGAVAAVRRLNDAGYYVFVVTNQSGLARGLFNENDVIDLHGWINEELRAAGAHIDDWRYCPHHPDGSVAAWRIDCACRKPAPGMILDLMKRWPIIEEASVMIGDREADAIAGRAAGITTEIVRDASLEGVVARMLGRHERSLAQGQI
jgi:D,D-heptose 1,7-bisphosphate phosphatase